MYGRASVRGLNGTSHCSTIHSPSGWQATKHDAFILCLTKCDSLCQYFSSTTISVTLVSVTQSWYPYLIFTLNQLFLLTQREKDVKCAYTMHKCTQIQLLPSHGWLHFCLIVQRTLTTSHAHVLREVRQSALSIILETKKG